MKSYDEITQDFLTNTQTTIKKEFKKLGTYFADDEEARNIWTITLSNNRWVYKFTFGDSIFNTKAQKKPIAPSDYSILACLNLLYEDSFEDFCNSFWYDQDNKNSKKTYNACIEEDRMLRKLFTEDELYALSEIS